MPDRTSGRSAARATTTSPGPPSGRRVYVHAGGSPQALATLRAKGRGQLVFNADEFRWGGVLPADHSSGSPPHNLYTDGQAAPRSSRPRSGAKDGPVKADWKFAPDAPLEAAAAGRHDRRSTYPHEHDHVHATTAPATPTCAR